LTHPFVCWYLTTMLPTSSVEAKKSQKMLKRYREECDLLPDSPERFSEERIQSMASNKKAYREVRDHFPQGTHILCQFGKFVVSGSTSEEIFKYIQPGDCYLQEVGAEDRVYEIS